MKTSETHDINHTSFFSFDEFGISHLHVTVSELPTESMQWFRDEAKYYFGEYPGPVIGYVLESEEFLTWIRKYSASDRFLCIVARDEEYFDRYVKLWRELHVYNVMSLDLTACQTMVALGRQEEDSTESEGHPTLHIPEGPIFRVIESAAHTGHLAIVLCSTTRTALFMFPFGEEEMLGIQGATLVSNKWRPYRIYDKATVDAAIEQYGHLNQAQSEAWGVEILPCYGEGIARIDRERRRGRKD